MKRNVGVSPAAPSATLGLSMDTVGAASSSVTVPVPVVASAARVAFTGSLNVTSTVSAGSSAASLVTATSRVWLVVPMAKVSVPAVIAV